MEEIVFTSELGKENIQRLLKKNLIRKIVSALRSNTAIALAKGSHYDEEGEEERSLG